MIIHLSEAAVNAAANAIVDLIDAGGGDGTIKIYADTMPTDADTAVGAQVLISEHNFSATAFGAASAGVVTANAIDSDPSANATDVATWARIADSAGDEVMDIDVGESGTVLILDETSITAGDIVAITSAVFTMPDGT